ncbi:MAG: nucleoside phosphorylase [Chloroflexi bacterium]|nr:MAG: nucleoside phosphorylase [Chloroflexota bacterium]
MNDTRLQYHLQCRPGDIGGYVLLPGDPGRSGLIASAFDSAQLVASNREYTTYTGTVAGTTVSVTSTGIGGPSTAIAVEELANLGAHTLVRLGTCGGMQPQAQLGDLVIVQAAVRDEGTTAQYVPAGFPATANLDIVLALREEARARGLRHHVGVVQSKDSFYGEMEPERMPVSSELEARWAAWIRAGVIASEMECASLFTVAAVRGIRAGAAVLVVNETPVRAAGMPEATSLPLQPLIDAGVGAVRRLIASDAQPATSPTVAG